MTKNVFQDKTASFKSAIAYDWNTPAYLFTLFNIFTLSLLFATQSIASIQEIKPLVPINHDFISIKLKHNFNQERRIRIGSTIDKGEFACQRTSRIDSIWLDESPLTTTMDIEDDKTPNQFVETEKQISYRQWEKGDELDQLNQITLCFEVGEGKSIKAWKGFEPALGSNLNLTCDLTNVNLNELPNTIYPCKGKIEPHPYNHNEYAQLCFYNGDCKGFEEKEDYDSFVQMPQDDLAKFYKPDLQEHIVRSVETRLLSPEESKLELINELITYRDAITIQYENLPEQTDSQRYEKSQYKKEIEDTEKELAELNRPDFSFPEADNKYIVDAETLTLNFPELAGLELMHPIEQHFGIKSDVQNFASAISSPLIDSGNHISFYEIHCGWHMESSTDCTLSLHTKFYKHDRNELINIDDNTSVSFALSFYEEFLALVDEDQSICHSRMTSPSVDTILYESFEFRVRYIGCSDFVKFRFNPKSKTLNKL